MLLDTKSPVPRPARTDTSIPRRKVHGGVPAAAVGVLDGPEVPDAGDEGAEEKQVDEGHEHGGEGIAVELEQSDHGPGGGDDGDDEEDEDRGGRGIPAGGVFVDKVGEHAPYGDEGDDLKEAEEEEDCGTDHCDGCGGGEMWWLFVLCF